VTRSDESSTNGKHKLQDLESPDLPTSPAALHELEVLGVDHSTLHGVEKFFPSSIQDATTTNQEATTNNHVMGTEESRKEERC
jgi:hypothetical protein